VANFSRTSLYQELFESSMDGILFTAHDGTVLDANFSACRMFGRTYEQLLGAPREALIDTTDPRLPSYIEERKRKGKVHAELIGRRLDGTLFPVETTSSIVQDDGNNHIHCIILRDVTSRKNAETQRERHIDDLKLALAHTKSLSGLLCICSYCKRILDEYGMWRPLEAYVKKHSSLDFTHGVCTQCMARAEHSSHPS
jgi:PAS domain S-box-containing protein